MIINPLHHTFSRERGYGDVLQYYIICVEGYIFFTKEKSLSENEAQRATISGKS